MSNFYVFTVIFCVWVTIFGYIYILQRRDPNLHSQVILKFILLICVTIGFTLLCNFKMGPLPPLGPFLDPVNGYLALVGSDKLPEGNLEIEGLQDQEQVCGHSTGS